MVNTISTNITTETYIQFNDLCCYHVLASNLLQGEKNTIKSHIFAITSNH